MLEIVLEATDEYGGGQFRLEFEHSLRSIAKWESIHEKPFFGREERTPEEALSYFRIMLLTKNPPGDFIDRLTVDNYRMLNAYINAKYSATTFREDPNQRPNNSIVTSEQMYDWMIDFSIPWEAQDWHYSRFLNMVRIRSIKQTKKKPMTKAEQMQQYSQLNAERRKQLNSAG